MVEAAGEHVHPLMAKLQFLAVAPDQQVVRQAGLRRASLAVGSGPDGELLRYRAVAVASNQKLPHHVRQVRHSRHAGQDNAAGAKTGEAEAGMRDRHHLGDGE